VFATVLLTRRQAAAHVNALDDTSPVGTAGPTGLHHVVRGAWVPRPAGVPCTWIWDRATQPEHPAPWAAASSNCPVPPQPGRTDSRRSGSQLGGDAPARPRRSPRGAGLAQVLGAGRNAFGRSRWPCGDRGRGSGGTISCAVSYSPGQVAARPSNLADDCALTSRPCSATICSAR
jgi:hypothetical protein